MSEKVKKEPEREIIEETPTQYNTPDYRPDPDAEQSLAPQLGTEPKRLAEGETDERMLTKISPVQAMCFAYLVEVPKERGGNFLKNYVKNACRYLMSAEGWRAKQMVETVGVSKGASFRREVDTRSFTEKHITMRDEEKAKDEGKIRTV